MGSIIAILKKHIKENKEKDCEIVSMSIEEAEMMVNEFELMEQSNKTNLEDSQVAWHLLRLSLKEQGIIGE